MSQSSPCCQVVFDPTERHRRAAGRLRPISGVPVARYLALPVLSLVQTLRPRFASRGQWSVRRHAGGLKSSGRSLLAPPRVYAPDFSGIWASTLSRSLFFRTCSPSGLAAWTGRPRAAAIAMRGKVYADVACTYEFDLDENAEHIDLIDHTILAA